MPPKRGKCVFNADLAKKYPFMHKTKSDSDVRCDTCNEKVWATESSALQVETLRAILYVKYNMTFKCLEFYDFLKTQPELLRKIAGQDKYAFKPPPSPSSVASTSMMSIDTQNAD